NCAKTPGFELSYTTATISPIIQVNIYVKPIPTRNITGYRHFSLILSNPFLFIIFLLANIIIYYPGDNGNIFYIKIFVFGAVNVSYPMFLSLFFVSKNADVTVMHKSDMIGHFQ